MTQLRNSISFKLFVNHIKNTKCHKMMSHFGPNWLTPKIKKKTVLLILEERDKVCSVLYSYEIKTP